MLGAANGSAPTETGRAFARTGAPPKGDMASNGAEGPRGRARASVRPLEPGLARFMAVPSRWDATGIATLPIGDGGAACAGGGTAPGMPTPSLFGAVVGPARQEWKRPVGCLAGAGIAGGATATLLVSAEVFDPNAGAFATPFLRGEVGVAAAASETSVPEVSLWPVWARELLL